MGIGYTLRGPDAQLLVSVGAQVGQGTNNEAEYQALLSGMRHALRLGFWDLLIRSDSLLVVNQMEGNWKVRDSRLRRLHGEAGRLRALFRACVIVHNYREDNAEADALSRTLTYQEPPLPSPPESHTSRHPKKFLDWQAAAVRVWWLQHHPGSGTLSRIFGVAASAIEAIGHGQAYRMADFSTYDAWISRAMYALEET